MIGEIIFGDYMSGDPKKVTVELDAGADISMLKYEGKVVLWNNKTGTLVPDSALDNKTTLVLTGNAKDAKIRIFPAVFSDIPSPRISTNSDNPVWIEGGGFTLADTSTSPALVNTKEVDLTRMKIASATHKEKVQEEPPQRRRRSPRFGGKAGKIVETFTHALSTPNDSLIFNEQKDRRRFVFDDPNEKTTAIIVEESPPNQSVRVDFFNQKNHLFTLTGNEPRDLAMAHWNKARENALHTVERALDANSPPDPQLFAEEKKRLGIDPKKEKGTVKIEWKEKENPISATLPLPNPVSKPQEQPGQKKASLTAKDAQAQILAIIDDIKTNNPRVAGRPAFGDKIDAVENAAKEMLTDKTKVPEFNEALQRAIQVMGNAGQRRPEIKDFQEIETKLRKVQDIANQTEEFKFSGVKEKPKKVEPKEEEKKEEKETKKPETQPADALTAKEARDQVMKLMGDFKKEHAGLLGDFVALNTLITRVEKSADAMVDKDGHPNKAQVKVFHTVIERAIQNMDNAVRKRPKLADECGKMKTELETMRDTANRAKELQLSMSEPTEAVYAYADVKSHDERPVATPVVKNIPGKGTFLS